MRKIFIPFVLIMGIALSACGEIRRRMMLVLQTAHLLLLLRSQKVRLLRINPKMDLLRFQHILSVLLYSLVFNR